MKVGLLADTHDNVRAIRYLVQWFDQAGAGALVHAGDFVSPFTVPELASFPGPVQGVFGNNDGDREMLLSQAEGTSVEIGDAPRRFPLGDREWLLSHRPADLPGTIPPEIDVVVHGHTHVREREPREDHLLVNPGEAGGWLTECTSAALLDTEKLQCEFHLVPAP